MSFLIVFTYRYFFNYDHFFWLKGDSGGPLLVFGTNGKYVQAGRVNLSFVPTWPT